MNTATMAMLAVADKAAPEGLAKQLQKAEKRRRWTSMSLTLPLLAFLLVVFLIPLATLMLRAVENPEVADTLTRTGQALDGWDRSGTPSDAAYAALVADLGGIAESARAGALARRLNTEISGARSLIMSTYRALPLESDLSPAQVRERLIYIDARWGEEGYWQAIAKNSSRWTPDYLLTAVDLRRTADGRIASVDAESAAFRDILVRTFVISSLVTLLAIVVGYPLSYWLSTLSERKANMVMILVLVPFWTSVLVRIAAWIVLLQNNGLINRFLQAVGLTQEPIELLFNRTGVVIAMLHILLPFMILPLYSVMKSVPPNYLRAAVSLGSQPLAAFFKVYVPQTYPGIAAGGLLVFITCIGYYVTPALLGGPSDQMISYYVARYTNVEVNWGMAAALGGVLLVTTLGLYAVYRKFGKAEISLG